MESKTLIVNKSLVKPKGFEVSPSQAKAFAAYFRECNPVETTEVEADDN